MAEPKEMESLKRAYAEMILKSARDAAARVMLAESKARRLEREMIATRDESARMLLRLKQLIDAKSQEAEVTSSNEHKKINELESQLNEAEGIIVDLRAELNQAQEQLDEAKKRKLSPIKHNENAEVSNVIPEDKYRSVYEVLTSSLAWGHKSTTVDDKSSLSNVNFDHNKPMLDEIKEPELLKNGCTQRICATETSSNPCCNGKVQHGLDEAVSVIRKSVRKRKLKYWDDVIAACGLRQYKKTRENSPLSKVKQCAKSGGDQAQAEDSLNQVSRSEEKIGHSENQPETAELIDVLVKPDELAAAIDLNSASRIDCEVKGATPTKATNISRAKRKINLKCTFSKKWKKKTRYTRKKIVKARRK